MRLSDTVTALQDFIKMVVKIYKSANKPENDIFSKIAKVKISFEYLNV